MLGHKFYFASVRKHVAAFGKQFTDVYVRRMSGLEADGDVVKTIKVPLAYGPRQKWLSYIRQNAQRRKGGKMDIKMQLPRMAFEMTGMNYDPSRKLVTIHRNTNPRVESPELARFKSQLNPVPWNFSFDLHIMTKNLDDGFQIVESIVPFFTPQRSITVNEIEELGIGHDCPIIFQGITSQDTYEGSVEENRIITWTLSFMMCGYIYPPVSDVGLIKKVINNLYADEDMEKVLVKLETYVPEDVLETIDITDRDEVIESAVTDITEE